jgi:amino acid transporter
MGRVIGAVVLGYIAIFVVVFVGLSAFYLALGLGRAFQPGTFEISPLWIMVSLVVGFAAAFLGGRIALRVARGVKGPRALALVVVVLGIALALPVLLGTPPELGPRPEDMGPLDAMQQAQTPLVAALLNPLVGALGVLLGGRALGAPPAPE